MSGDHDPIVGGRPEKGDHDEPHRSVIDGPPRSNWQPVLDALKALVAAVRNTGKSRPRRIKPLPGPSTAAASEIKAFEQVHGKPMLWMAPFFLVFAFVFAFPHAAKILSPEAPRVVINDLVARLPEVLSPLSAMMAGWLWLPWFVALPALLMRLRAAWTTGSAIMDAVGWSMAALVIEGGAWLYFGRMALERAGTSAAERDGAWQLLAAEFIFLFLVATILGPHTPRPRYFNQHMR